VIRTDDLPWLRHHQLQSDGKAVFPIAGYIAMALEAASQRAIAGELQFDDFELRNIAIGTPLVLNDEEVEITITLRSPQDNQPFAVNAWQEFRICSWVSLTGWREHCKGLIAIKLKGTEFLEDVEHHQRQEELLQTLVSSTSATCSTPVPKANMYDSLAARGAIYGPTFQGIENCRACSYCSLADITVPDTAQTMPQGFQSEYIIHPAVLQQIINMYLPMLGVDQSLSNQFFLPSFIGKISVSRGVTAYSGNAGDTLQAFCIGKQASNSKLGNVKVFATVPDDFKEALITIDAVTLSPVYGVAAQSKDDIYRELCFKMQWEPASQALQLSDIKLPESLVATNGELPTFDTEVVIIEASGSHSPLLSRLEDILHGLSGKQPVVGSLGEVNADGKFCIFLAELDKPFLASITKSQFDALQTLLRGVKGILWVVRGAYTDSEFPEANMVSGLSRTVRSETLLPFATLDLDTRPKLSDEDTVKAILAITKVILGSSSSSNAEMEYTERAGKLHVPRIVDDLELNKFVHQETQTSAPELLPFGQGKRRLQLVTAAPVSLDTLHFIEQSSASKLLDDEIEIRVKAIGVNTTDVKSAINQLLADSHDYLGIECSGIVTSVGSKVTSLVVGDRVAAITKYAYATFTRTKAAYAFKVRGSMSFEVAAAIPVAYCTAYHGLFDVARLCQSKRLLINMASTGVGQAAVLLAQTLGAETFASVKNFEQKELIMKEYNVDEDHIFYTETSFGEDLQRATNEQGVDIILNCALGHTSHELWDCLGKFGNFVETGDPESSISGIRRNANFSTVDLVTIAAERPHLMERLITDISKLLESRTIRPASPVTVFSLSKLETVLSSVETGEVHGKLVVAPKARDLVKVSSPKAI
jgi:NADPH:quinone reductase-like Zn-dependent oxidoreductase